MSDGQPRFRLAAQTGLACAKLNLVALVAMAVALRPGLPPTAPLDRIRYLHEHALAWKSSWALWILTTVALALFYLCLHRALGTGARGRVAVALTVVGLVADLLADGLFISQYPGVYDPRSFEQLDRWTALLSGGLANGAYTAAWQMLAWRAPFPAGFRLLLVPGLIAGYGLALSGFLNWTPGLVAGTAVAIPCFSAWAALVGRFFWKNAAGAVTMSPHV